MIIKNTENVKYFSILDEKTRLHISNGNAKLGKGIYTLNLMPGDAALTLKNGTALTNVPGTCSGCCSGCKSACYAINDAKYHHNSVIPALAENTQLALHDPDEFFSQLDAFVKYNIVSIIRVHSSGEIPNYNYLLRLADFANRHKDIKLYGYTKRFNFIERYISEFGALPENLIFNMSIWHGNYNNPMGLPEFIYDDGTEPELASLPHCPAVNPDGSKTGVTCAMCRRCINAQPGTRTAVYAH